MKKLKKDAITNQDSWRSVAAANVFQSGILKSILTLMVVLMASLSINAQTVSSIITDTEGDPLIGANVLVKGTSTGTISDIDGSYSLSVNDLLGTLVFSYVGFENIEVEIGGRTFPILTKD